MTSQIQASPAVQAPLPPARIVPDDPTPTPSVTAPKPAEGIDATSAPQPESGQPKIGLSVAEDTQGVFVYVLTDSADGRVLAIVPRGTLAQKGGRTLDVTA